MVRPFFVAIFATVTILVAFTQAFNFPDGVAKRYNKKEPSLFWTRQGEEYRLPKSLEPTTYSIRLLPFVEEGNFTTDGYLDIRIHGREDTNSITMNSKEIEIDLLSISVTRLIFVKMKTH